MKDQFGLGFKDELKSTGREILSAVGSELTGAAKDKAMSLIKEQLGLGEDEGSRVAAGCCVAAASRAPAPSWRMASFTRVCTAFSDIAPRQI